MASLKLVRSPISRVLFDSWFQAIAPRQENERLRKFVLGSGSWRSYIVRTPQIIVMNFRGSMKPLLKVLRTIIIEYFKHRN